MFKCFATLGVGMVLALSALAGDQNNQQTIAGKISGISDESFKLQDQDSKTWQMQTSPTLKTSDLEGKQAKLSELKEGTIVAVTFTKQDGKNSVSQVREARSLKGKINSASNTSIKMTDNADKQYTLAIDQSARVMIGQTQGKASQLKEGSTVTIYYYQNGERQTAAEIRSGQ